MSPPLKTCAGTALPFSIEGKRILPIAAGARKPADEAAFPTAGFSRTL
jgi:hypothetical protein